MPPSRCLLAALVLVSLAAACSAAVSPDAGRDAGAADSSRLSASAYLMVIEHPSADEGAGTIGYVQLAEITGRPGTAPPVLGARVSFNEQPATDQGSGHYQTPLEVPITGAAAGGSITLVVESSVGAVTLRFECPTGFALTQPAEGAHVTAGQDVPVAWTGRVVYSGISESAVQTAPYDPASNHILFFGGEQTAYASIVAGATATTVRPQATTALGYVLDLGVTGDAARQDGSEADCIVTRRIHLARD